jgi:hypothetical protein
MPPGAWKSSRRPVPQMGDEGRSAAWRQPREHAPPAHGAYLRPRRVGIQELCDHFHTEMVCERPEVRKSGAIWWNASWREPRLPRERIKDRKSIRRFLKQQIDFNRGPLAVLPSREQAFEGD